MEIHSSHDTGSEFGSGAAHWHDGFEMHDAATPAPAGTDDTSDGFDPQTLEIFDELLTNNPFPGLPGYDELGSDPGFPAVDPSSVQVDTQSPTMIGQPDTEAQYWLTQGDEGGTCAPTAVAMVLEQITGVHFADNDAVVQRAEQLGLIHYDPTNPDYAQFGGWSGMQQADIVTLAESFGLDVTQTDGATLQDLESALQNGDSVLLFLDADEIWNATNDDAQDGGQGANHEVVLTGIDPVNGLVYLNDSGQPDAAHGAGEVIPLQQFLNAWADSNNAMIVTNEPDSVEATHVDLSSLGVQQSSPTQTAVDGDLATSTGTADTGSANAVLLPFTFLARAADLLS